MGVKPRTEEEGRRTVEEAWKGVAAAMEHEACGVLDEVDANGQPRVKHTGRQAIPLIVQAPLFAPRKSARHGAYLQQHAAAWVATRLEQMKAAAEAWQKGTVSNSTKQQWGRMQKAFSKPSSLMHKLLNAQDKREEDKWRKIMEDVKGLSRSGSFSLSTRSRLQCSVSLGHSSQAGARNLTSLDLLEE